MPAILLWVVSTSSKRVDARIAKVKAIFSKARNILAEVKDGAVLIVENPKKLLR